MVKEYGNVAMGQVISIKGNIRTIKKKGMEYLLGLWVIFIKEIIKMI